MAPLPPLSGDLLLLLTQACPLFAGGRATEVVGRAWHVNLSLTVTVLTKHTRGAEPARSGDRQSHPFGCGSEDPAQQLAVWTGPQGHHHGPKISGCCGASRNSWESSVSVGRLVVSGTKHQQTNHPHPASSNPSCSCPFYRPRRPLFSSQQAIDSAPRAPHQRLSSPSSFLAAQRDLGAGVERLLLSRLPGCAPTKS